MKVAWRDMSGFGAARVAARLIPPLILLVGIGVTYLATAKNRTDHDSLIHARFLHETDRILSRMAEDVRDLTSLGRTAQAALGGTQDVDGTAWWRFTSVVDFERTQPAVRALAYIHRIEAIGDGGQGEGSALGEMIGGAFEVGHALRR